MTSSTRQRGIALTCSNTKHGGTPHAALHSVCWTCDATLRSCKNSSEPSAKHLSASPSTWQIRALCRSRTPSCISTGAHRGVLDTWTCTAAGQKGNVADLMPLEPLKAFQPPSRVTSSMHTCSCSWKSCTVQPRAFVEQLCNTNSRGTEGLSGMRGATVGTAQAKAQIETMPCINCIHQHELQRQYLQMLKGPNLSCVPRVNINTVSTGIAR